MNKDEVQCKLCSDPRIITYLLGLLAAKEKELASSKEHCSKLLEVLSAMPPVIVTETYPPFRNLAVLEEEEWRRLIAGTNK